ncbi:MAG: multiheme c-type cytochrome [Oligoflexales bacterium]
MRFVVFMTLMICAQSLFSQSVVDQKKSRFEGLLNQLLAPGPLMLGHHDLEHKDCLSCHEAGGGLPDSKCLSCHDDIGKHVNSRQHFHGRAQKKCATCHSDHKGRQFNSALVNQRSFDHNLTGYILGGGHSRVACLECHKQKRTTKLTRKSDPRYFGQSDRCIDCHKNDDVHKFKGKYAKEDCKSCHQISSWKHTKFDHKIVSGFSLNGSHSKLECKKCHENKSGNTTYKWPQLAMKQCRSCHDDFHGKGLSIKFRNGKCHTCHNEIKWKILRFDHKVTDFVLKGKHKISSCKSCHVKSKDLKKHWSGQSNQCVSCHADYHGFGKKSHPKMGSLTKCQSCHNEIGWKNRLRFNHNVQTSYPLTGMHKNKKCISCHVTVHGGKKFAKKSSLRRYKFPEMRHKSCETCHKSSHSKSFHKKFKGAKCESCHNTKSWKNIAADRSSFKGKNFHNNTRFPLTGKHKSMNCQSCHIRGKQRIYKFPSAKKDFCISCHKNIHKQQFHKLKNEACSTCHTTQSFKNLKRFNHSKTDFKITGKHRRIGHRCHECHSVTKWILDSKPPRRARKFKFKWHKKEYCENCHRNQHKDMFSKKFSTQPCVECHTTSNFSKRKPFKHQSTRFPLKGKHKDVDCIQCHKPTKKKFRTKPYRHKRQYILGEKFFSKCVSCHKDPHKGTRGKKCQSCHNERSWKGVDGFHKNFQLKGVHLQVSCESCHAGGRVLAGTGEQCQTCHFEDDHHQGSLPQCADCHMQTMWSSTKFQHDVHTRFSLVGKHRLLPCSSCHNAGIYKSLPMKCSTCHFQEGQAVTSPNHSSPAFQNCVQCHNTFSFK